MMRRALLAVSAAALIMILPGGCSAPPAPSVEKLPGDPARGYRVASRACASCHGMNGNPAITGIPKLAEQYPEYLVKQLKAFVAPPHGRAMRISPVMAPVAAALSPQEIDDVASWYARSVREPGRPRNRARLEQGAQLFLHGDPEENLPACASCHRATGAGIRPDFPNLAGQDPAYVERQLQLWEKTRGHPGKLMSLIVPHMSPGERAPLADYIASLKPRRVD